MSDEHRHHLFHHKEEEKPNPNPDSGAYGSSDYQTGPGYNSGAGYVEQSNDTGVAYGRQEEYEKALKEEKQHKRREHMAELGITTAGAYALYEKHEAKKDPENARRHKIEEEVAAAAAVGGGGFAFHEHHEKKEDKKEEKEAEGKKHHHLF
uniref:TSA: Wollemia nobilis Ref_Wollemi_Transcript_13557_1011 transcribed RNA sequence n=1 Tax=Wollemia nobilis TaxID=56998 RepID=A0A0C9S4Y4_9CONI